LLRRLLPELLPVQEPVPVPLQEQEPVLPQEQEPVLPPLPVQALRPDLLLQLHMSFRLQ
jgi:hypothetical protein